MSTAPSAEQPTRVGIGIVARGGTYLVRQRLAGTAMAGYWEFPGGKCEPGETPEDATLRECFEEIGLRVSLERLRDRFTHRYPHAFVELSYFDCVTEDSDAEPDPKTGFRWVAAADLLSLPFPGANGPILESLLQESRQQSAG